MKIFQSPRLHSVAFIAALTLPVSVFAGSLVVSMNSFSEATLFSITPENQLDLRVSELTTPTGDNAATHILIEQLAPVGGASGSVYGSPYSAVAIETGNIYDTGVLYLNMPEAPALPAGSVASPIVGIVARSGSWQNFGLQPVASELGGASGASTFDSAAGTLTISMTLNGTNLSGTANYTVIDTATIAVEPFSISGGQTTVSLSATTLVRSGNDFFGSVANLTPGASYDSLFYQLALTNIPDVDGDGIPDIVDDDISIEGDLTPGEWVFTYVGWVYGYSTQWGYSDYLGYVFLYGDPHWYIPNYGAFANAGVSMAEGNSLHWFAFSELVGWSFFNNELDGDFAHAGTEAPFTWAWANVADQTQWSPNWSSTDTL